MFVRAEQPGDCLEQLLPLTVGGEELKWDVTHPEAEVIVEGWLVDVKQVVLVGLLSQMEVFSEDGELFPRQT